MLTEEAALRIELHRGNKLSVLDVQYDRAIIGSGAHCDVRLAPDEAAIEQLVVEARGVDEVYAQVRALDPPCLLNGAPFLEGRLLPTSMLELGSVALSVQRSVRSDVEAPTQGRKSATSPFVQAMGLIGIAVGLFVVLNKPKHGNDALSDVVEPPLSAAIAPLVCPQQQPRVAAALAEQARGEAENKRERAPFYPGDALDAISLFERAAACYEVAGERERAREAHDAAQQLHTRVGDELHVRHVRLERFLAESRYDQVRRQAQLLGELVSDKSSRYAQWLSAVRREAELQVGETP